MLGIVAAPIEYLIPPLPPGLVILAQFAAGLSVIMFFGFLWAFAYFMLIVDEVMYDRDEHMTENIIEISEEEGYERVLMSCGGEHRPGIASYLEDQGWETEEPKTDSPIEKILLWTDRASNAMFNPRDTFRKAVSRIRQEN